MAAYAALLSLMNIIQQIQHTPRHPLSLDEEQFKPLTGNIAFFQEFLESYSGQGSTEARRGLESRIADAAYSAEDLIGSHVVDLILSTQFRNKVLSFLRLRQESPSSVVLHKRLQKVTGDMDSIKGEVLAEIRGKSPLQYSNLPAAGSSRPPPSTQENTMVGFEDILIDVMDKLTRDRDSNRQIIPVVGMGGIGKTTLAHNVYLKPLIVQYFDIRAWVTVSQEYSTREILIEILSALEKQKIREKYSSISEGDMGEQIHKHLFGRIYLIVMDDVWSIDAWDKINIFLPNSKNGSKIMMTTRLTHLALSLVDSHGLIEMKFLDEGESWTLLSRKVFQEENCPLELEKIGKRIAKNCKGLPLSISVIGGLLSKSSLTKEYWNYIAQHISSTVNSEENQRCLEILYMSYIYLPVHLKPCFLFMGVFPEDCEIRASRLITLWVGEGFLKPMGGKSIEVAAEDYLKDLIDRNLVFVHKKGSSGNIKSCKIHDLLRDMCLREGQNEKFHCVVRNNELQRPQELTYSVLKYGSLAASYNYRSDLPKLMDWGRIFTTDFTYLVNHEWNLQTVIAVEEMDSSKPFKIWKMSQLRHLRSRLRLYPWWQNLEDLPDSSSFRGNNGGDDIILENLQTLTGIKHFKCSEQAVKRIPNIKRLEIYYCEPSRKYSLNNLCCLHKLESFTCSFLGSPPHRSLRYMTQSLTFSHSLKKVTLEGTYIPWEDVTMKLSPLPFLQVLKLQIGSCSGSEWNLDEGHQFFSLKYLLINELLGRLEHWRANSINFPCLEQLVLRNIGRLKNFPKDIGEIPTLRSIQLDDCSYNTIISAKEMVEEQEELGNEELRVRLRVYAVKVKDYAEEVESLASHNFEFF